MRTKLMLVFISLLLIIPGGLAVADGTKRMRPGTVIYKLKKGATASELKKFNSLIHRQVVIQDRVLKNINVHVTQLNIKGFEKAFSDELMESGAVKFAEPDYMVLPTLDEPNDEFYSVQWHHETINSPQAWDHTTGETSILVAVLDTGVDTDHPDLADNLLLPGYNTVDNSANVEAVLGHGTGTAGTIGAVGNNVIGVAGVTWKTSILPVKVNFDDVEGYAYISDMAKGIIWAAEQGARVVNLSYGGAGSGAIDEAATYLRNLGGLLFMSAGNGKAEQDFDDFTSFVVVGATDESDQKASFSDWGHYVDITAPGTSIATTYLDAAYVYYSGTSFSSPMTAGLAALILSINPELTPADVESIIFNSAVDLGEAGDDIVFGHGRINAGQAVEDAASYNTDNMPPTAIASASPLTGIAPLVVAFNAGESSDDDGMITSYLWDFDDGNTGSGPTVSHTYEAAGDFAAKLSVTDNQGAVSTAFIDITVDPDPSLLIAPSNLTASVDGSGVNLSWSDNSDNEDGFLIERAEKIKGKYAYGSLITVSSGTGTISYTDSTADIGTYKYRIRAFNGENNFSDYTNEVLVKVEESIMPPPEPEPEPDPEPEILNAPSDLSAQISKLEVTLTWTSNNADGVEFYVERGVKITGKIDYEKIASSSEVTYTDLLDSPGTYYYRVQAYKVVDGPVSDYSNVVTIRIK